MVVFTVYEENINWALRIPRRIDVVNLSSKEKHILDFVEPNLPVQVPKWEIHSDEFIAYKLLRGVPAGTIDSEAKA